MTASRGAIPCLTGARLAGNLAEMRANPIAVFARVQRELGDVGRIRLGHRHITVIFHPDHIRQVFVERPARYAKSGRFWDGAAPVLGEGLLNSNGNAWRQQRKLLNPLFHRERLAGFAATFVERTLRMAGRWRATQGQPIDLADELTRLVLATIGPVMFGVELGGDDDPLASRLKYLSQQVFLRGNSALRLPDFVPTAANRRFRAQVEALDDFFMSLARTRRAAADPGSDLVAMLLEARDEETGEGLSDRQLRDQLVNFYTAGHLTTASGLAWTFYLLLRHPEVLARVRDELARVLAGRAPTFDDARALTYTSQVIDESLRLYPPGWVRSRSAIADDEIDGHRIRAGTEVYHVPFLVHRDPRFWDDPQVFDPDRFLPERARARHPGVYSPFGIGQRKCIGASFAILEMQMVLATLLPRVELTLEPGFEATLRPSVTLRPRDGLPVRVSVAGSIR